jgi:predicted deacylase
MKAMSVFSIGDIRAEPGAKAKGFLPSEGLSMPDGTVNYWHIPVIIVNGAESGPVFEVDGCMHGDEQEGAYTVLELAKRLDPKTLKGTFVGVPVLNVPGFLTHGGVRGITTDLMYVDMNRQFPGDADSMSHTRRAIHTFWNEIILKCDYTVNLHGCPNGQIPRVVYNEEMPGSLEMAEAIACTPEWIMASRSEHTRLREDTINRACTEKGIPNVFIESGSADRSHSAIMADVEVVVEGIMNCMRKYGMLEGKVRVPKNRRSTPYYTHVRGKGAGIIYPEPCLTINNEVKEGELLCRIVDFLGNEIDQVKAPHDGIILMEPNHVSVGPESSICLIGYPPETNRTG